MKIKNQPQVNNFPRQTQLRMDQFDKFYLKAVHFLKFRPRSEKEIRDNLAKKKASPEVIEKIITLLKEQRYVDDAAFVKWWIEQRSQFRQKSMRIVKLELRQKGISPELLSSVLENEETEAPTDLEQAEKLVEKRIGRYKGLSRDEVYKKLGAFLARRGFDWEIIKTSIDDAWEKEYNS